MPYFVRGDQATFNCAGNLLHRRDELAGVGLLSRTLAAGLSKVPELLEQGRRMREASSEDTLSGHLRRAIHGSTLELPEIAAAAGIDLRQLNEFLCGERTLRSDVLDRLALSVGFTKSLQA